MAKRCAQRCCPAERRVCTSVLIIGKLCRVRARALSVNIKIMSIFHRRVGMAGLLPGLAAPPSAQTRELRLNFRAAQNTQTTHTHPQARSNDKNVSGEKLCAYVYGVCNYTFGGRVKRTSSPQGVVKLQPACLHIILILQIFRL